MGAYGGNWDARISLQRPEAPRPGTTKQQVCDPDLQHELNAKEIAEATDVERPTVFRYISAFGEALLEREHKGGRPGTLKAEDREDFLNELRVGCFRRAKEARTWIVQRTRKRLSLPSIYQLLGKVSGDLKVRRNTHAKKDPLAAEIFKFTMPERLAEASAGAERTRL